MDGYTGYCSDCKTNTEVVFDHSAGDTICSACGLVLESHSIDETSEWRKFSDDTSGDRDPTRVGGPTDPFLNRPNLTTVVSNSKAKSGNTDPLFRREIRDQQDCNLIRSFESISAMAERLGLVATIKHRAKEKYKKVDYMRLSRGRNANAYYGACLLIACQEEGLPRTLKEICSVANGTTKKEINRARECIKRSNIDVDPKNQLHAVDLVKRFCSKLGMRFEDIKAVREAVRNAEEVDVRRNPISILAAVIYIVMELSGDDKNKRPLRQICVAAEVAEATIKKSFRDLHPYLLGIVPSWFATEDRIRNLRSP